MDIRVMQYYLAVTREGSISAAAESLHISQPSLSRQMKDLEEELGTVLFERGHRITLTQEGIILRKRAEEMLRLMQPRPRRSHRQSRTSWVTFTSERESRICSTILPKRSPRSANSIRTFMPM